MNNEYIHERELLYISIIFIDSMGILMTLAPSAGRDSWIAILIAFMLKIPIVFMLGKMINKYPNRSFFEIIELILGKILGKIVILIILIPYIQVAFVSIIYVINFIKVVILMELHITFIAMLFLSMIFFILNRRVKVIVNWSQIIFFMIAIVLLIITSMTLPFMDIKNMLPIIKGNEKNILKGVVEVLAYPASQILFMTSLFKYCKDESKITKVLLKATLISGIFLALINIQNTMVLGDITKTNVYFANYQAYRRISIGKVFQRIELVLSMFFIITEVIRISILILFIIQGIGVLVGINNNECLIMPTVLMLLNIVTVEYMSLFTPRENIKVTNAINIFFNYVLVIIIYGIMQIKEKMKNVKSYNRKNYG